MFDGGKVTKWKQGDYEFAIRKFNPFYAIDVLGELNKVFTSAFGGGAVGLVSAQGMSNYGALIAAVGGALSQLSNNVDGKTLEKSCRLLLDAEYLGVKGKDIKTWEKLDEDAITAIFTGRPWDMIALCFKVFEVNYLDFSTSSSVPIGVQKTISEILGAMRELAENTSAGDSSSIEP